MLRATRRVVDRAGRSFDVEIILDVDAIVASLFSRARRNGKAKALHGGVMMLIEERIN